MYPPVCINMGMMALPQRRPSSGQWLCKGRCVGSRAEARKDCREILDLEAGAAHSCFQRGALRAAWQKQVAVSPSVPCKVIVGLLHALWRDGPRSWCFYVNLWALGARTTGTT